MQNESYRLRPNQVLMLIHVTGDEMIDNAQGIVSAARIIRVS